MTIALWCVLFAGFLPVMTVAFAKAGARNFDNSDPRRFLDQLTGIRKRADLAHRNHFEAFPFFAVSVIIAQMLHGAQGTIDAIAVTFIVLRLVYTGLYLFDKSSLRTLVWSLGMVCIIANFVVANRAAG